VIVCAAAAAAAVGVFAAADLDVAAAAGAATARGDVSVGRETADVGAAAAGAPTFFLVDILWCTLLARGWRRLASSPCGSWQPRRTGGGVAHAHKQTRGEQRQRMQAMAWERLLTPTSFCPPASF
jgi:hypothetical protein